MSGPRSAMEFAWGRWQPRRAAPPPHLLSEALAVLMFLSCQVLRQGLLALKVLRANGAPERRLRQPGRRGVSQVGRLRPPVRGLPGLQPALAVALVHGGGGQVGRAVHLRQRSTGLRDAAGRCTAVQRRSHSLAATAANVSRLHHRRRATHDMLPTGPISPLPRNNAGRSRQ